MLYLPSAITKIILILLSGLISFHMCFLSSKSISGSSNDYNITNASEEQYQNYLDAIYSLQDKREFISNTKATYLFGLSQDFSLFFFVGYFSIATALILSSKFNSNKTEDEKS